MMPSAEDWRIVPLRIVSNIFEREANRRSEAGNAAAEAGGGVSAGPWTAAVSNFFREKFSGSADWRQHIPDLEFTPNHELVDGQVVRFRAMIQDMFDPEYYFSEYKVRDLSTGRTKAATGRYRDFSDCGPREEVLQGDGDGAVTAERQMFFCISAPGVAPWVRSSVEKNNPTAAAAAPSVSNPVRRKRPVDDDDESMEVAAAECDVASKKAKGAAAAVGKPTAAGGVFSTTNFPIPGEKGQAAIVKVYDAEEGTFSLNDLVEFVGVVSLDPALAHVPLEGCDAAASMDQFQEREMAARNPPASLVPRLHALAHFKVAHCNPLVPREVSLANRWAVREESSACRSDLRSMLSRMLLGDGLAADYLICHLVSRVYHRRDVLCLGKFSLNLFNVPLHNGFPRRACAILRLLLAKSHYLPLTLDNLNRLPFVPKKDYHANRLVTGLLQLSAGTHLLLDETAMENGQLTADGLRNLAALGTMISWQRVEYNFNYHQIEFSTDVPCLVLSEGRSMLPSDVEVMLKPESPATPSFVEEGLSALGGSGLDSEFLDRMRRYLTVVRLISDYDLADDIQKEVQEDFVAERRAQNDDHGRVAMTTDDLHAHLVLARSVGISRGEFTLTKETWEATKGMERQRKQRMAHLPPRRAAAQAEAVVAAPS